MADHETVRAARESPVGDERDFVAEPFSHNERSGFEHFGHARSPLRSAVPNDDHRARLNRFGHDRFVGGGFAVENAGRSLEAGSFLSGDLRHRSALCQIPVEDLQVATRFEGRAKGADDFLSFAECRQFCQILGQCFTRYRQAVAVEVAFFQHPFHHGGYASDLEEVLHDVLAGGFQVGYKGHPIADALDVVDAQRKPERARNGDHMQHSVGAAAEGNDDRNRIFESPLRDDVARLQIEFQQIADRFAGTFHFCLLGPRGGGNTTVVGQGHAHRFDRGSHGVGGVHAATGTRSGAGFFNDLPVFGFFHFTDGSFAEGLEGRYDVQFAPRVAAGTDGTTVHQNGRTIQPTEGHHCTGHIFIASHYGDQRVVPLRRGDGFDTVGNDVARGERKAHAVGTHAHAVAHPNGVKDQPDQVLRIDVRLDLRSQPVKVHVAGIALPSGTYDAYLRLVEILVRQTDAV